MKSEIIEITSKEAPSAIGPYSHAVVYGELVFTSGQIPLDPITGEVVGDDIESQITQVLKNLEAVLDSSGSSFKNVLKTTIFLKDLGDFQKVNEYYSKIFHDNKPARSTVQVAKLPRDVRVEIEMVAVRATS